MKKFILSFVLSLTVINIAQHRFSEEEREVISIEVKEEFLHAWNSYMQYAKGYDALKPLSGTGHNWYAESFLMTPIDAFDTMILMGLKKESEEAKELIFKNLNLDKDIFVQNFEITIRLLGGLLSAYQWDGDNRFLELAKDLGDRLLPVFDTQTGLPYTHINLKTGIQKGTNNNPAEIGTLMLEFGMLSRLTGDIKYYEKAKRAVTELFNKRSEINLVGTSIDIETGEWTNSSSHISGMIDSYYEYLLKAYLLFDDKDFLDMWEVSIKAVNKYLLDETKNGLWYGQSEMHSGKRIDTKFGALDAFMPGLLALSGDTAVAKDMMESCYKMWLLHSIEPEQINYSTMEVVYPQYVLRPEIIESAYYLLNFTNDHKYLEMGKRIFYDIKEHCKVEKGYAALKNVITKEKDNQMESFFLAETLKYLYLLFSPESKINFDEIIFNTEAHPFMKIKN